jgi:chromosome segregation ATPase
LQVRLKILEQELNSLRYLLERREAEHQSITERLEQHQTEVDAIRAEAEVAQAELRVDAARYQAEFEAARHSLQASRETTTRLQTIAGAAKDRIDTILMRLPGAPQE